MAPDPRLPMLSLPGEHRFLRLLVGPSREAVVVSLDLAEKMPDTLLSKRVTRNQGNIWDEIMMEDDAVPVVISYLEYLKTGKIYSICPEGDDDPHVKEWNLLASLYYFGQKYEDIKLKNIIIDALVAKSRDLTTAGQRCLPPAHVVCAFFDYCPSDSPVRKLMVDMYVIAGYTPSHWPVEGGLAIFTADLETEMIGNEVVGGNSAATALNSEDYHETEGVPSIET